MRLISKGFLPLMRVPLSITSPLLGTKTPTDQVEQGGFTCAIRTNDADTFTMAGTAKFTPRMISVLPKLLRKSFSSSA
jgi:hypothetical protein